MDHLREFVIPFAGLKPGIHPYDFEISDSFFARFEYSVIRKGRFAIHLDLEKEANMLVLHFDIRGDAEVTCDRCLEPFSLPLAGKERLVVKYGAGFYEEDEEVQVIPEGETQFDISPFLYEYLHLLLPIRKIHPDDENSESRCNREVIQKLDALPEPATPDPRWEILKKLRDTI